MRKILVPIVLLALITVGCNKKADNIDNSNTVQIANHMDQFTRINLSVADGGQTLSDELIDAQNNIEPIISDPNADIEIESMEKVNVEYETEQETYIEETFIDPINLDEEQDSIISYQIDEERLLSIDTSDLSQGVKDYIFGYNYELYEQLTGALYEICLANNIEPSAVEVPDNELTYTDDYMYDVIIFRYYNGEGMLKFMVGNVDGNLDIKYEIV